MQVDTEEFRNKLEKLSEQLLKRMEESNFVGEEVYRYLEVAQDMVDSAIEEIPSEEKVSEDNGV